MNINTRPTKESLYVGIVRAEAKVSEGVIDKMAQHFWPVIGTANQVAFMAIDDAVERMQRAGMYRQKEKWHAKKAVEEFEKYERAAFVHFQGDDRYHLWQDLIGRAAEKLSPDVMRLYFAIKNVIDKDKVPHSDVLAQIQLGVALVTFSTMMFDMMLNEFQRETVADLRPWFIGGRLTGVESNWKAVGELTGRKVMADVNLRDDAVCRQGVQVLMNRYADADFINDACGEALQLNPDTWHHISEMDRDILTGKE